MFSNYDENEISKIAVQIKKVPALQKTVIKNLGEDLFKKLLNEDLIVSKGKKFGFSDEAKQIFNEMFGKKPKSQSKTSASKTSKISDNDLQNLIDNAIEEKLKEIKFLIKSLDERLSKLEPEKISEFAKIKKTKEISSEKFIELLSKSYELINFQENRGGMVPIPKIWDELSKNGVDRSQFESELFSLEKKGVIDLQTASDSKLVKDIDKSIRHPARGLINYIVWRK